MIPYGRQDITEADIQAVVKVLRSDFVTQGPVIPRFEQAIAAYCGVTHGVAVNSATSALHVACQALGMAPGDSLWTSPNSFVASANCALYCGADVDFVDIDPQTYNISVDALEEKLVQAEKRGHLPKVLIAVHFAGQSCDMKGIHSLASHYGFRVIEDASHAIGGKYLGEQIGNCRYSDITVFSFHPVKIITTGEGGLAVTNDRALAEHMSRLRSHGVTRDPNLMQGDTDGPWYYQQIELGWNYRMTDIQAALGLSQFSRLNSYIAQRHQVAQRYDEALASLPLILPHQHVDTYSAYHLYPVQVDGSKTAIDRGEVFADLRANGIGVNVHYIPIHTQPYYQALGFKTGDYPVAEGYYRNTLSLPMYPTISAQEQQQVITALQAVFQ
jgi:UDP-4-amino-4,6-dideoxy-N-acetyl-beta-L-altrosamine transaminase